MKHKNTTSTSKLLISLILIISVTLAHSQITIWSENYETGYTDGDVTAQDNNLPAGADWILSGSGEFMAVSNTLPISGTLSYRTRGGGYTMTTEPIDISSYSDVSISVDLNEINASTGDKLETFYNVDGTGANEFGDGNGDAEFDNTTNSMTGLNGSTLVITIIGTTNAATDKYKWDNILVQGTTVLPTNLIQFTANTNSNHVELEWNTASEINGDYFTIERSTNLIDWEEQSIVEGAGNSSSIHYYKVIDKNPTLGISYYRLKHTDIDGSSQYFSIRKVKLNPVFHIYPNPTIDKIFISSYNLDKEQIKIYNTKGQDITYLIGSIKNNDSNLIIDIGCLERGIYYIKTKNITEIIRKL